MKDETDGSGGAAAPEVETPTIHDSGHAEEVNSKNPWYFNALSLLF